MPPFLHKTESGDIAIRWRTLLATLGGTVVIQIALSYFTVIQSSVPMIAASTIIMALTWMWVLRRYIPGQSLWKFSLRDLFIGFTGMCLVFALGGLDRQSARETRANRERLQVDIQAIVGNGTVRISGSPGSTHVRVNRASFGNDDLKEVLQFTEQLNEVGAPITFLDLSGTGITDRGISSLVILNSLEFCFLGRTKITDKSIGTFENLPDLKVFSVMRTAVIAERLLKLSIDRSDMDISPKTYQRLSLP